MSLQAGIDRIKGTFYALIQATGNGKLVRPGLRSAAAVVASGIRAASPRRRSAKVHRQQLASYTDGKAARRPLNRLSTAIRSRVVSNSTRREFLAKAGVNVGLKRPKHAPQGAWVGAGTRVRTTRKGQNRGRVTPRDFVRAGVNATSDRATSVLIEKTEQQIQKIARRT